MTLANRLTLLRILLTFLFMFFLLRSGFAFRILALCLFLIASLTDLYDGKLARFKNQVTPFGKLMDPIADKILVIAAFAAFVQLGLIPAWMLVLVLSRELLITGVRLFAFAQGQGVLPADRSGKHKTVTQMAGILWVLIVLVLRELPASLLTQENIGLFRMVQASVFWVMFVTVWVTVGSGLLYLWRHRLLLTPKPNRTP